MILFFINIIIINRKPKNRNYPLYFKEIEEELDEIQRYIDLTLNETFIDKVDVFLPLKKPKISIIIAVYNGEGYLKKTLLSVQNQDFKDIEIVIIDDHSIDNSLNLIKKLMDKDKRIVLYQNNENKGIMYTKIKAILLARGKYILILDEDDIYGQRDAFSVLYREAETNNLDLLEFRLIYSSKKLKKFKYRRNKNDTQIIYQPSLSEKMFGHSSNGEIKMSRGLLQYYFIKRNILVKAIKQIDKKYLYRNINHFEDYLIFFLLTRIANNCKYIDRFFYIKFFGWNKNEPAVKFRLINKYKDIKNRQCFSLLEYLEIMLSKTKNTFSDKKIAVFCFNKLFLQNKYCKNNTIYRERAKSISQLYLDNKYIQDKDKYNISLYLKEINSKNILI